MPVTAERLPNGLILWQDDTYFKLGQDSVLLSAFAKPRRNARVLDLGCGTGALALLLYRPGLAITGLELQQGALALFRRSIADNGVPITAKNGDLREIRTLFPHGSMDYVICNPPYFDRRAGKSAPSPEKRAARQDGSCTVEEVAVASSFVLHTGGKAAFVFRPERLWTLLEALSRVRLVPKRLRFVHQNALAAPSAVLVECRKGGSAEGLIVEPPLLVESAEYREIYGI
ncbi:MAG: methyltransferase [Eubacteriales bacterium]|nr:methyltransferase [Eubacteriales bacterium]